MSEIKSKVKARIAGILAVMDTNILCGIKAIDEILSIPELAIVDREAELPHIPEKFYTQLPMCRYIQKSILKAGWVKEVKDE